MNEKNIPTVYATTVLPSHVNDISTDMQLAYNLSKTIKCLALIDIFFGFLYSFYNFYFIIPIFFALFGYYGAKKFNKKFILIYFLYEFITNITRLSIYIWLYFSNNDSNYLYPFIFSVIFCLIGIYISKIIYRFKVSIDKLTPEEISLLRNVKIVSYRYVVW